MNYRDLREIELEIIIKAWRDEDFRKRLLKNSKKVIEEEFNISIPKELEVFVHEEDENKIHLIVPTKPTNVAAKKMTDDEILGKVHDILEEHHQVSWPYEREENDK